MDVKGHHNAARGASIYEARYNEGKTVLQKSQTIKKGKKETDDYSMNILLMPDIRNDKNVLISEGLKQ